MLRSLYRTIHGYSIPAADARAVERSRGSATYGELMPTATLRMLAALELGPKDVFVDLGSGVGKVVMLAAMATSAGRAIGIELSRHRVACARRALAAAERTDAIAPGRVAFRRADMLRARLDDATVVYTCSTAFDPEFLDRVAARVARLPKLRWFVSLRAISAGILTEDRVLRLDASWQRRTRVFLYRPG